MDKFIKKYKELKKLHMSSEDTKIFEEAVIGAKNYLIGESIDDTMDVEKTEAFLNHCTQILFGILWMDWRENETDESSRGVNITKAPKYTKEMTRDELIKLSTITESIIEQFEQANDDEDILLLYRYAIEIDGQSLATVDDKSTLEEFAISIILRMLGYNGDSWEARHANPHFDYPSIKISYTDFPDSFPVREEPWWENDAEEEIDEQNPEFWKS
jgi:hypothetical protein